MTKRMTVLDLQTHILPLLDQVAAGETIEITKRGRTVARLVPPKPAAPAKSPVAPAK